MNFYSVDGSNYDNLAYQNCYNKSIESFDNVPMTTSNITDDFFECSDSFEIKDESEQSKQQTFSNSTQSECKAKCLSNKDCVGFNFNNQNNNCTLFSNVTSLNNPNQSNSFCIKKMSGSRCQIPRASIPLPGMKVKPESSTFSPDALTDKINKRSCKVNNKYAFVKLDQLFENLNKKNKFVSDTDVEEIKNIINNYNSGVNKNANIPFVPKIPNSPLITQENYFDVPQISENVIDSINSKPKDFLPYDLTRPKINSEINSEIISESKSNIDSINNTNNNFPINNIDNMSRPNFPPILNMPNNIIQSNFNSLIPAEIKQRIRTITEMESKNIPESITPESMSPESMSPESMAPESKTTISKVPISGPTKPKIYVDMNCFMNKMGNMKNSENIMMDLNLLTANIKSCAFVPKNDNVDINGMNKFNQITQSGNLVDQVISKIDIPKPNTIDLDTLSAKVLVTQNAPNPSDNNKVVGLVRENFTSSNKKSDPAYIFEWGSSDLIRLIIIILILYLLIFRKK